MDERDAEREVGRSESPRANPGKVIILGAVAMALGAVALVHVLYAYASLAGTGTALDTPEMTSMRTPEGQTALWIRLVESAFLAASGMGVARLREWARTLFIALAIWRVGVLALLAWESGPSPVLAFMLARDALLFGVGVRFLTRPAVVAAFRPPE